MMRNLLVLLCLALATTAGATQKMAEIDRSGSVYISPRLGLSYPVGALSDANYNKPASSWRKEGLSLTGEIGYYVTNSTVAGMEVSYSNFHPRTITGFDAVDDSRVRIRRAGLFIQYSLMPTGKYRPFMKLGAGLFEITRISMPTIGADTLEYRDYTLGAKPVGIVGFGVHANFSPKLTGSFAIEAVWLNSFSSAWETTGSAVGPLNKNMLYFPVYFSLLYHLSEE